MLTVKRLESFASKKLLQDMQERLLLMSHYRLQQILDTVPSMNNDTITKLLVADEEQADPEAAKISNNDFDIIEESIPYAYVVECHSLLKELEMRLKTDIYRGILLEVV